ncbi:hypothetical protein NDU88_002439 [Pleurodeles waltl]|uniref:Uncharacterized protein n=1 Tax=Pleurodeles waltl TaxID=8319 RepID=A0AAV7SE91_PLEWA|nr:hypothetical protein NDU88_002439 [Pleurodeles waltl]
MPAAAETWSSPGSSRGSDDPAAMTTRGRPARKAGYNMRAAGGGGMLEGHRERAPTRTRRRRAPLAWPWGPAPTNLRPDGGSPNSRRLEGCSPARRRDTALAYPRRMTASWRKDYTILASERGIASALKSTKVTSRMNWARVIEGGPVCGTRMGVGHQTLLDQSGEVNDSVGVGHTGGLRMLDGASPRGEL